MRRKHYFPGPKSYLRALKANPALAMISVPVAATVLGVKPATVQGYVRDGSLVEIVIGPERSTTAVSAIEVDEFRRSRDRKIVDLARKLLPVLEVAASKREYAEYSRDLMEPFELDHHVSQHRDVLGKALGRISVRSNKLRGHMLSVICIRKKTRFPNDEFFKLAREIGRIRDKETPEDFFERESEKVFRYYSAF